MASGIQRLKSLSLTFSVLCGMTMCLASAAQATWLVEGKELTVNEGVEIKAVTVAKFVIPTINMEIRCSTVAGENVKLIAKSAIAEGNINFSGCKSFLLSSGSEVANCNPSKQPIKFAEKALIILHEGGDNYILLEPAKAGGEFGTIEFSELCALTETAKVTGTLVDECGDEGMFTWTHLNCSASGVLHDLRPASQTLFPEDKASFATRALNIIFTTCAIIVSNRSWAGHV